MKNTNKILFQLLLAISIAVSVMLSNFIPGIQTSTVKANSQAKVFLPLAFNNLPLVLMNGDFELGRAYWIETSLKNNVNIINTTADLYKDRHLPVRSGKWITWLGGATNENASISQKVTINPGYPYLSYWHWIGSLDSCTNDKDIARILVNGNVIASYDLCKSTQTNGWKAKFFDLSGYAGQDVTISINVITDGTENSNLFIDDVTFTAGPTTATGADTTQDDIYSPELADVMKSSDQ